MAAIDVLRALYEVLHPARAVPDADARYEAFDLVAAELNEPNTQDLLSGDEVPEPSFTYRQEPG